MELSNDLSKESIYKYCKIHHLKLDPFYEYCFKRKEDANPTNLFIYTCWNGYLDFAQWLYYSEFINVKDTYVINTAFIQSCKAGHLHVVQWLYSLGNVDIHNGGDWSFFESCSNGHLHVAQWLYSFGYVNIHLRDFMGKNAFQLSCKNGHLPVAQWLYYLKNSIEGHGDFVEQLEDHFSAFKLSCEEGHLHIAQWLLSLGIPVSITFDYPFLTSCKNGQLHIAQWLY